MRDTSAMSSTPSDARTVYAETARLFEAMPPPGGRSGADVVVVGGGITGLSTALHLAERGLAVSLIEANTIGWGASGRNGGQVNPGLKYEPSVIERQYGTDLGRRMVRLSATAPQRVFDLVKKHGIECEARQAGTLRVGYSAATEAFLRSATEDRKRRGEPVDYLDRDAVARATGTDRYRAGALDRRGGSLNPLAYARGLAHASARLGASIHENTRALSLAQSGSRWMVTTPEAEIAADWVVLGTNGYTDGLLPGLARTIVPVFGGIVASEPLAPDLAARILPGRESVYEHESITAYYRVDAQHRVLIGGRSRLRPLDGPEQFPDLSRYARRLWPFLADIRWTHGWNGQLAITTDAHLRLSEPMPGLISCIGYNGRGVAMATAMGGEIARRIDGAAAETIDMPFRPLEQIPLHGFWRIGASARIAYGRIRGRLGI